MKLKTMVDELKNKVVKEKKEADATESLQARIIVSTLCYNNSAMVVDENGECHKLPIPDPVEEEFLVKKGDRVKGFEVSELTTNFIVLKSFMEYTDGKDSTPKNQFMIEKGEGVDLRMYGVYDEVNITSIKCVEVGNSYEI